MASYVPVPRDLTKVKTKILFGLTKRQLICFSIAAAIGVPVFFLLKRTGNVSLASIGMMIVMLPLFFLAMYERDGMPLEVMGRHFIEAVFIRPKVRPYITNNYYDALMREHQAQEEVNRIVLQAQKQKGRHPSPRQSVRQGSKGSAEGHRKGKKR